MAVDDFHINGETSVNSVGGSARNDVQGVSRRGRSKSTCRVSPT